MPPAGLNTGGRPSSASSRVRDWSPCVCYDRALAQTCTFDALSIAGDIASRRQLGWERRAGTALFLVGGFQHRMGQPDQAQPPHLGEAGQTVAD